MAVPELQVVALYDQATAADIAGSLRRAADSVEAETDADDRTVAIIAVQVRESGRVDLYGWGRTDSLHTLGALTRAIVDHGLSPEKD